MKIKMDLPQRPQVTKISYFLSIFVSWWLIFLFLMPAVVWAENIKVFLDETRTDYIMAEKMDCKVHKSKRGITLGFKAGNILFGVGPEISFGGDQLIKWEKNVQGIIARYQELCARFNTGSMTKKEYDKRINEIDVIAKEAMLFQERIKQRVKNQASNAFNELEKETRRDYADEDIDKGINGIRLKVKELPILYPEKNRPPVN